MKTAFLLPYIGPLPPYFHFWAKSCETNANHFHWYVYSDHAQTIGQINPAVTIIPYQFEEIVHDFKLIMGIEIRHPSVRMLCNYRLLFYFLRRGREPLEQYHFIGYTDMDMIYGELERFMPANMDRYTLISADPGYPCGPFTLIRRDRLKTLSTDDATRRTMVSEGPYSAFDESKELLDIVAAKDAFWCRPDGLQPARTASFNRHRIFSIWKKGRVTICDNRGHRAEGGFHHFSRYKGGDRFAISADPDRDPAWAVYKKGILPVSGRWSMLKVWLSMLF